MSKQAEVHKAVVGPLIKQVLQVSVCMKPFKATNSKDKKVRFEISANYFT